MPEAVVRSLSPLRRVLRSEFLRHGSIVFASTTLVNAFNYIFHSLISRRIGVDDYGALSSLFAGLAVISVPAGILTMIVVKFAAEFRALGDRDGVRALAEGVLRWTALAASAAVVSGLLLRGAIAHWLNMTNTFAVGVAIVIFGLGIVLPGARGILQGTQDFGRLAVSSAIEAGAKAALGVSLVYAGFGLGGAMAGFACGTALSLVYTLFAMRTQFGAQRKALTLDLPRLWRTTGGVGLATLALTTLGFADVLLVKHFFDPQSAGIYGAVSLTGKAVLFAVGFVPTIVLPKATARAMAGQDPVPILAQAAAAVVALSGCGLAVLYFFPLLAVRVMAGASFSAASQYVFSYGIVMAMLAATAMVVTYKIAIHRFDFVPPLLAVMVGEIVAINFMHASLAAVIRVLMLGNALALGSSLYRITAPLALRSVDQIGKVA